MCDALPFGEELKKAAFNHQSYSKSNFTEMSLSQSEVFNAFMNDMDFRSEPLCFPFSEAGLCRKTDIFSAHTQNRQQTMNR